MFSKHDSLVEQALCANIVALDCLIDKLWAEYQETSVITIPEDVYATLSTPEMDYIVKELDRRLNF